jgi:TM2 domain-containing membrane protein YozV
MDSAKNSGVAILLSFLWPGLGQLYAGRIARGLSFVALEFFLWGLAWILGLGGLLRLAAGHGGEAGGIVAVAFGSLPVAFWAWGMTDARRLCEAHNRGLRASRTVSRERESTPVTGYPSVRGKGGRGE